MNYHVCAEQHLANGTKRVFEGIIIDAGRITSNEHYQELKQHILEQMGEAPVPPASGVIVTSLSVIGE